MARNWILRPARWKQRDPISQIAEINEMIQIEAEKIIQNVGECEVLIKRIKYLSLDINEIVKYYVDWERLDTNELSRH